MTTCIATTDTSISVIMPFAIGDKVQAVDENGHWSEGKVIGIPEDGTYTVTYNGWTNDYDNAVREPYIRCRALPMEQQTRGKPRQSYLVIYIPIPFF